MKLTHAIKELNSTRVKSFVETNLQNEITKINKNLEKINQEKKTLKLLNDSLKADNNHLKGEKNLIECELNRIKEDLLYRNITLNEISKEKESLVTMNKHLERKNTNYEIDLAEKEKVFNSLEEENKYTISKSKSTINQLETKTKEELNSMIKVVDDLNKAKKYLEELMNEEAKKTKKILEEKENEKRSLKVMISSQNQQIMDFKKTLAEKVHQINHHSDVINILEKLNKIDKKNINEKEGELNELKEMMEKLNKDTENDDIPYEPENKPAKSNILRTQPICNIYGICKKQHNLEMRHDRTTFQCDRCTKFWLPKSYCCLLCDYDLCEDCHKKVTKNKDKPDSEITENDNTKDLSISEIYGINNMRLQSIPQVPQNNYLKRHTMLIPQRGKFLI